MNQKSRIVLGITGSIAAYKSLKLVRLLIKEGISVQVVMTENAKRFISPLSFETLSKNPVATDMFEGYKDPLQHISLTQGVDLIAVVPATANIIGKVASGIADDLLSSLIIASSVPVFFAPCMDTQMWLNPIVQENIKSLKRLGYEFVEPEQGELASGKIGKGKLAPIEKIYDSIKKILERGKELSGKYALVTTGRTEEPIDPVRVITNRSSGRMGFELAKELKRRGAQVKLICAEAGLLPPEDIETEYVSSSQEMLKVLEREMPKVDILVMTAAIADFKPSIQKKSKLKERSLSLKLERTPDILKKVIKKKKKGAVVIGFSVDTEKEIEKAKKKLKEKGLDFIVANPVKAIGSYKTRATLLDRKEREQKFPELPKSELAKRIIAEVMGG